MENTGKSLAGVHKLTSLSSQTQGFVAYGGEGLHILQPTQLTGTFSQRNVSAIETFLSIHRRNIERFSTLSQLTEEHKEHLLEMVKSTDDCTPRILNQQLSVLH